MDCTEVRDDRMDALYGEARGEALQRVEAHHATCRACREEFEALGSLRRTLAGWRLPERSRPRLALRRPSPAWGLAAAAALLLAAGAALRLSGASLEYHAGPVSVRLGGASLERALQDQERRHSQEIQGLRATLEAVKAQPAAQPAAQPDESVLLAKVEQLVRDNEQRQAARFATSLEDFAARTEAQRRYDLARVSAGLSYLDGKTGEHVARTSELMGYMLQASEKR
jgi:hypothetical protein